MSAHDEAPEAPRPSDYESLRSHLRFFTRLIVLLLAACLLVSASLNLYLASANADLKKAMVNHRQLNDNMRKYNLFLSRLVGDLKVLGKRNGDVLDLLKKHGLSSGPAPVPTEPSGLQ